MRPDDYDASTLHRRLGELATGQPASARDVAWFDLALSVGLLRHLSDVHIGCVNPKYLAVGINVERKKLDLARFVRDALAKDRVGALVCDAEPTFVQYRNLKTMYARYRALAADSTLPRVTLRRTVRPGDSLEVMVPLRRRLTALAICR